MIFHYNHCCANVPQRYVIVNSLPFLGCTCFRSWHGQLLSCCGFSKSLDANYKMISQLVHHQFCPDSVKIVIIHQPTCHRRCKVKRFSQKVENVCESVEMSNLYRSQHKQWIRLHYIRRSLGCADLPALYILVFLKACEEERPT